MSVQCSGTLSGSDRPQLHGLIVATAGEAIAVRTIDDRGNGTGMSRQRFQAVTCLYIPNLNNYAANPVTGATLTDFDPLERERLRQMIERFKGDASLLDLTDDELDGALGLVRTV